MGIEYRGKKLVCACGRDATVAVIDHDAVESVRCEACDDSPAGVVDRLRRLEARVRELEAALAARSRP